MMTTSSKPLNQSGKLDPRTFFRPGHPACPNCGRSLAGEELQSEEFVTCPRCAAEFVFCVFPAVLRRQQQVKLGEAISDTTDASCFYHADKKADVACDECGRFLCSLCDIEMDTQHSCPSCFDSTLKNNKNVKLERSRALPDSVALWTAVLPILFWPMTLITGPISIYLALRAWNAPTSILGRTKIRLVLALLLGLVQVVLWAVFSIRMFNL